MEIQKTAIQKQNGLYSIDGKLYTPFKKAAAYVLLIAGIGAGSLLLSDREDRQLRQENEQLRQNAASNTLEMTCEQLSKQDTTVRLPDGSLQKLTCDENGVYGIPATQERGQ